MIRKLTSSDLAHVASLHHRVLGWSINGRLGRDHIVRLYRVLEEDPGFFGFVDEQKGELRGFITATSNHAVTRKRLLKAFSWKEYVRMLANAIIHPVDFLELFENAVLVAAQIRKSELNAEILTWVTDTSQFSSPVVATRLFNGMVRELQQKGFSQALAQVVRYDASPNKFHQSRGTRLLKSFYRTNIYVVEGQS